jgi:hypothetical protein
VLGYITGAQWTEREGTKEGDTAELRSIVTEFAAAENEDEAGSVIRFHNSLIYPLSVSVVAIGARAGTA